MNRYPVPFSGMPAGLRIGHASDETLKSGVTVLLPDEPAVMSAHIGGGAPGTRELGLAEPEASVSKVDAIVLSGGSAFGLAAADGAMSFLAENGRGFEVAGLRVPIVPTAILFDLANGGDKSFLPAKERAAAANPYPGLAYRACSSALEAIQGGAVEVGTLGAGTGATTANLKGGFGHAGEQLSSGATIAAFVAVNAVGAVTFGDGPHFRAAPFEVDHEFGGLGLPATASPETAARITKFDPAPAANTTIAVIATDQPLTKAEAKRLAIVAHDGFALSIYPAHTPFDGDTVFALSTGKAETDPNMEPLSMMLELCAATPVVLARAVARAVYWATDTQSDRLPTWKGRFGDTA
ncbi:P1 family peptidase [Afifella sp. YEN Y35]|uniref:P1 family peptidase n=1 Tax=Afifella sp. YEN Y35 TaxID=3388337 RepID=UPI0039E095A6